MPIRIDEMSASVPAEHQDGQTTQAASESPPGPAAQQDELRRRLYKLEQRKMRVKAN